MKRIIFIAISIIFMLSACTREATDIIASRTNESIGNGIDEITLIGNLPNDDETTEPSTRTDYDFTTDSQKALFSWKTGDQVALVIYDKDDGRKHQNKLTFTLSAMSEDKKTATFGGMNTYHINGYGSKWLSAGFAVYPTSIAQTNGGTSSSYTQSYVKLPSTVSGEKSSVILVGVPNDNENPTNFDFKSATAVLRVTITGIPANAKELRLGTSNKDTYPIDGDFYLVNNSGTVTIGFDQYQGSGNGYQSIDLSSAGAIASREFLFNIPVGEYPANTLKLQLLDNNNNILLEKKVAKDFNFRRNHFISTPHLANEWITLGIGKYADYWMQGAMGAVEDMWDVTIQKSTSSNTYRIDNPYSKGVEMKQTATHSEYLYFTVVDASTVSFVDHITGVVYPGDHNFKLKYVSTSTQNKVILGTAEEPQVIQLAPDYTHNSEGEWNWPRNTLPYLIRIVMPDYVSSLTGDITFTGNVNQCKFNSSAGSSVTYNMAVAKKSYPTLIKDKTDQAFSPNTDNDSAGDLHWSNKSGAQNATCSSDQLTSAGISSGPVYVIWYTVSGSTILTLGSKRMYFLTPDHSTSYMHQYNMTYTTTPSNSQITLTLGASDNPSKGNVMLTEFNGVAGKLYGNFTGPGSSANLIFKNAKTTPFTSDHYVYSNNNSDLDDLNLAIGYNTSASADYDKKSWTLISFNRYIIDKIGSDSTSYKYMRGEPVE